MNNYILYEHDRDGNGDIIEDCSHPDLLEVSRLHGQMYENLTPGEKHDLSKLRIGTRERRDYVRNKVLQLIQK